MDLAHVVGGDLSLDTTGDLATVDRSGAVQQRVLRRLMTNVGSYIWNLGYGGGFPSYVGQPVAASAMQIAVRNQMLLEASVAQMPVPTVAVASSPDNTVTVTITYSDAVSGMTQTLTLSPGS